MSIDSTITQANRGDSSCSNPIFKKIYEIGVTTAAGALAGHVFGIINPVGGAVFGASCALTWTLADAISDKVFAVPAPGSHSEFIMNRTALKTAAWFVSLAVSIGVGIFAATTAGFPLTVLGGVGMLLTMAVTSIAMRVVGQVSKCLFACTGGAALACKERYC
jgi:hypothetical protein